MLVPTIGRTTRVPRGPRASRVPAAARPARLRRLVAATLLIHALAAGGAASRAVAQTFTYSHFAGSTGGAAATDGTGNAARFSSPAAAVVDALGNIFVADQKNHAIRMVTPGGVVTTIAGAAGISGAADGSGSAARFSSPTGIAIDAAGTLYIADSGNCAVRTVTPAGEVSTLAGLLHVCGHLDATGTAARFSSVFGVAVDAAGTVYATDTGNRVIRRITSTGVVTTLAGQVGIAGTADGTGTAAQFGYPWGIAVNAAGLVYVSDYTSHTIRAITQAGVVTTFAGTAGVPGTSGGTGAAALFRFPTGLSLDAAGNLYVADMMNFKIRKVTPTADVSTHAGTGAPGTADGVSASASFDTPNGVGAGPGGIVYVADTGNHTLRAISAGGVVSTLAGAAAVPGTTNGTGSAARFSSPSGVAVDASGNVFVADRANHVIRRITPTGATTTFAGVAGAPGSADGTGTAARFRFPEGIAVDGAGTLFVADTGNHTIRVVTAAGVVTTLAGTPLSSGTVDGTGSAARFTSPEGIAVDGAGTVWVADTGNHTIRRITSAGAVTTFAGAAGQAGSTDATGASARFNGPVGIDVTSGGTLYVADKYNHVIRAIAPSAAVTTLAGSAGVFGWTDGAGSLARFRYLQGIALDAVGNIYVADTSNHLIRKVTAAGVVTSVGGLADTPGAADGTGTVARFTLPSGVAVDSAGNLYVADDQNEAIRKGITGTTTTTLLTVSRSGSGTGTVTSTPAGIACGSDCTETLPIGTVVTLAAEPSAGSVFAGWSGGGCSGFASCVVGLSAATTVTATFAPDVPVVLTVTKSGTGASTGTVTSTPSGISCGADCTESYPAATTVVLLATPMSGTVFQGWSGGGCSGTGLCVVTVAVATTVNAAFTMESPPTATLTVSKPGSGSGTVTSSPAGISCGSDCSQTYVTPAAVTLTAVAAAGSTFTGWSGAGCSGTGACAVNLAADVTVVATFTLNAPPPPVTLTVNRTGTGSGTVTSTPAGISCGSDCSESFANGTSVTLSAAAATGSTFLGWSGACSGTGACVVAMTTARTVSANFTDVPPPPPVTLTVSRAGPGGGTVTSTPAGISCGSDCTEAYANGSTVSLLAAAAPGSKFDGWSGACTGTAGCVVSMTAARSVTATFSFDPGPPTVTLTVVAAGTGDGIVTSTPFGISCGGDCTEAYPVGSVVTLDAIPFGSTFSGWSGGGCTGAGDCVVTMTAATTVTATFAELTTTKTFVVYLAEGATSSFIDTRLALLNPGTLDTTATLTFQPSGASPIMVDVPVPARRRVTFNPETVPGLSAAEFATKVESAELLIVDRTMSWDASGYGAHAETAVDAPANTWYLAEGATHSGFNLFYLLQNPNNVESEVLVRFFRPAGAPLEKTYTLPPASRTNIWVNVEDFPGLGAALASTDVSAMFTCLNGQPIIVERALYLDRPGQTFAAGHESAGVTAPATTWFLAEGATGPYFDLYVLVANTTNNDADVEAAFLLPDGTVIQQHHTVRANSRFNVWVDAQDPRLADTAVSTLMRSTNGVPIIVERALWWPGSFEQWYEAHNSPGATAAGVQWALAEGEVGGSRDIDTFILIANTSPATATVDVTLLFDDGTSALRTFAVNANSRFNVDVRAEFPVAVGKRFGALVESVGATPADIVVERAMYWDANGQVWAAGTNALARLVRENPAPR